MSELTLRANGIAFHALATGPENGPLVLLLHGFPELAVSWTAQLTALGDAGYRAIAPDMRGYGDTEKSGPYDLRTLAADVRGLVEVCGRKRAAIVGHDWGGAIAWGTALFEPQVVERLCVLNCPHPIIFVRAFLTNPRQLLRSWYMLFFQIPKLPELILTYDHAAVLERLLLLGATPDAPWSPEQLRPYRESMSRPGAAKAAVGYYRAMFRNPGIVREAQRRLVTAPTQIIWGTQDPFLGKSLANPPSLRAAMAPGNEPSVELISEAGHFVQHDAPERVNETMLRFLAPTLGSMSHAAPISASP